MTAKADRARELMNHPEMKDAFNNVRLMYLGLFEQLPLTKDRLDPDVMLDIRRMLELLKQVERDLENMIRAGNVADFRAQQPDYLGDLRNGRARAIS